MKIIVDGYNVLRAIIHHVTDHDRQRSWLISLLANYARKKNNELILVFDGGRCTWPSESQHSKLVKVVFSGEQATADDYIKEYLYEHQHEDLMLASSDREICDVAQETGKPFIGALHFYHLVQDVVDKKVLKRPKVDKVIKRSDAHGVSEVDQLMQEVASQAMPDKEEYEKSDRTSKGRKLSKHERTLLKKIKKL